MNDLVKNFMEIMGGQPISLALVVCNLLLLWYCFKLTNSFSAARQETMQLVVQWQKESQAIMAGCVSKEVLDRILGALERDRETYRAMLPTFKGDMPP
jgi:hypothetical protein